MITQPVLDSKEVCESAATESFLNRPDEASFAALFEVLSPQLLAFFRTRVRDLPLAEDLAQDVMLAVYRKAGQVRDRALFRAWVFKIAHNTLCRHYGRAATELQTVSLADLEKRVASACATSVGSHGFEFRDWMRVLNCRERDMMTLRFVEQWEYHEIAAARRTPIGTVQWRVFNSKKKLAAYLTAGRSTNRLSTANYRGKVKQCTTVSQSRIPSSTAA